MTLFGLLLTCGAVVDAVVESADVWGPWLLGVGALAAGLRRTPRRTPPDTSGQAPETCPDTRREGEW
ncbi:hypothetical protein [Streptomyces cinereoruber]|uniref:hypothetical protein n=1 Tax=Streptomyces cinereoruber TaxID=67260 RepID=UPI003642593F